MPNPALQAPSKPLPAPGPVSYVFGGTIRLPDSPHADMHGMVRAVVRTKLFLEATRILDRFGVRVVPQDLNRTWTLSTSHIEHELTLHAYGELFVCPLSTQYLQPGHYSRLGRGVSV